MIRKTAGCLLAGIAAAGAIGASQVSVAGTNPPVFSEVSGSPYAVNDASDGPSSIADAFAPGGKYLVTLDTNYQNVVFSNQPELDTLSVFGVSGGDSLTGPTQLTFGDGAPPTDNLPSALAVDPVGGSRDTIAVVEGSSAEGGASIGMFSLDPSTGQLTQWAGSPFPADDSNGQNFISSGLRGLAFSPDGSMLAVAGATSGHVVVYKVDYTNDTLTTQANLEETVGNASFSSVAWSPDGQYLAATDTNGQQLFVWPVDPTNGFGSATTQMSAGMLPQTTLATGSSVFGLSLLAFTDGNTIRLFKINSDGTLTEGPNSPFQPGAGVGTDGVAFNADGTMLATTDSGGQRISVMSIGADGTLADEGGSPYTDGQEGGPNTAAFGPAGGLVATANNNEGEGAATVHLFAVAPPTATISSPADNGTVFQYMSTPTQFNCADSAGAPGIYYDGNSYGCQDSENDIADHNTGSGAGHLNTNSLGPQTYSVTATSDDGQQSTTTIHYTVITDNASVSMTVSPSAVDANDSGGGTATSTTPVHVGVQVTSSSSTPSGQVTLVNGAGATVATLDLDSNGDASTTLTGLSPDAGPLKAEYGGANGPSATAPLRVGLDPVTLALNQLPTLQPGSPVQLSGSIVSGDSGDASPSGTIAIYDGAGGPVVGTATLNGDSVGGSEPFTVTLQNGLSAGQHTLVADFSDIEQRFAAGSASEQVSAAVSSSCYAVQAQPVNVATRVNGTLSYQDVPVQVQPQSDACGSTGVTSGGKVLLTATPPAYEQVTAFTVTTQDGGTSTVPVDNSPGAGQAATATITVTGPTSVTPVASVVNPSSCPSVSVTSHWLGSTTDENDLASFTVTGEVGCSVTAPSTTETVAAGSSFQALPGTPIQVAADSTQISTAAGDDDIDAIGGSPSGATVTATSTSFALNGSATINAEAKMVCTPAPTIVQSTGGTVAQSGEATIQSPGPMGAMLAPASTQNEITSLGGYSAGCPAAWGSGVVPGASITYVGTPTKDDQSLGLPASDPRTNWGVEGFQEADQTDDSETSEAASTLASTSLTPDLVGTAVTSTPVIHTLDEPGGTGTTAESDHALAVGFRFERLACVTVATDVASYGRDTAGVDTLGEYQNGNAVTLGSAAGALKIDTPPNCPAVGPDYYKPGTQIEVTAVDPPSLQSLSALTEEQHPGAYDGTTDPDYFAPGSSDTDLANARGHRRSGPAKNSTPAKTKSPTKTKAPTKTKVPTKKHKPKAAPRHIPKHAPPAAVRVPTVHAATSSASAALAAHDKRVANAITLTARASAAELRARRAVERAERGTNVAALKRTSRAWGTAERKWWSAELTVAADRTAIEKTAITQIDKLAAAQFGNGTAPSYGALPVISATLRNQGLAEAVTATNDQARRFNELLAATRTAAKRRHSARLKQELRQLVQMDALVRQHAAAGRRMLAADRRELKPLVRRETKADRTMVTHSMKLLASAQRASRAPAKRSSTKTGGSKPRALIAVTADANTNRPLYPDETASTVNGLVKVPMSFQGTYADDTDGLIIQNGGDSHTTTFTVGTSPMTVHATWGPSDCERPTVLPYDQSQVTVNIDGGAGACAGPGTVARLGTFVVNASPSGAAVPVIVVKGIAPGGQTQERIQVGSSESFPALEDSTVQVQVCEPLEFGGQVTDTVGGGTSEFDGSEIDQFASVVPGTGSECAVPGFYTVGTQVRFSLPSFLQPVVSAHAIVNPYAPTDGSSPDCTTTPGDCTQQPATGTADWEVDGTDVGSTAPTVTLDQNEPQHEVGLSMTVKCEKLTIDVQARYEEPGATLDTAPDCPVTYAGDGTTTDQGQGGNLETVTTAHYLAGDVAAFSTDPDVGQDDWSNLPSQPSNDVYVSGEDTLGGGPFYVDFAGRFGDGGTTVSSNETIQMQEGGGYAQYESWPDWNMPTLLDLESDASSSLTNEAEDLYSIATTYVLPVLKQFYSELDTVFTTDPFSSLSNFETWAKSAGILLLSAEDPNAGELMLGADYTGALDSPGDFATYLGQVGRFAASTGVQTAFTVAQTAGLSGAVQIGLALGDAAIVEISNGLTDIGAPSALVTAIRSARVLTNGINALEDCTTEAAAGDDPPTAPSDGGTAESDTGSALSNALSNAYQGSDLNEPPPLAKAYNSFPEGGTLSDAGSVVADATRDAAADSKVSIALNEIQLAHALPGPNYNWTASDYSNCLAAETVG